MMLKVADKYGRRIASPDLFALVGLYLPWSVAAMASSTTGARLV
jgi:hypothetical protein